MKDEDQSPRDAPSWAGWILLALGALLIALGWALPSRFNSVPQQVVAEAGSEGESVLDLARAEQADGNLGAARLLFQAVEALNHTAPAELIEQLEAEAASNPLVARWGAWDPFLEGALEGIPLEAYPDRPGLLGILIGDEATAGARALLANSRDPLARSLLETGNYTTYKRLFPVSSVSGRPLEATLLALGLYAQGDRFSDPFKRELRYLLAEAKSTGDVGRLEDLYLDALSLARLFDWGQLKALLARVESAEDLGRLRYLFHRESDAKATHYAMALAGDSAKPFLDYLATYGDEGLDALRFSLRAGIDGFRLATREGLPIERPEEGEAISAFANLQSQLAPFSLKKPGLALAAKYAAYFAGAFLCLWGGSLFASLYRERVAPALAFTQRFFGASALALVLAVVSEPYLARAGDFAGYTFRFVVPVLATVGGEVQITLQEPSFAMQTATLLAIGFFLLLQVLVFFICLLKIREIDRQEIEDLVKLKLMENEENLFDTGLYVGIAGTCVALVLQVLGLIEPNLLAAYSSNLFGILSVAIVKIRLVRPYKTRLIVASQDRIASLVA